MRPVVGLSRSASDSLATAAMVASRTLLNRLRYSALVPKPLSLRGGFLVVPLGETGGQLRVGDAGQLAADHAAFGRDQVAELPGDVVGAGDRPNQQVGVRQVVQQHAEHVLASWSTRRGAASCAFMLVPFAV